MLKISFELNQGLNQCFPTTYFCGTHRQFKNISSTLISFLFSKETFYANNILGLHNFNDIIAESYYWNFTLIHSSVENELFVNLKNKLYPNDC